MIITNFQKHSIKQVIKAHLTPSDKIENLKEFLASYHLGNQLDGYYTPQELFDNFSNDAHYTNQLKPLKKYLKFNPLASKHYYIVDANHHSIIPVTNKDVLNAEKQVIHILKHAKD